MRDLRHVRTSYKEDTQQLDIYGTINDDGTPHMTLITSLHAYGEDMLVWGQHSAGLSKDNQAKRPSIGFMSQINNRSVIFGKADWIRSEESGKELDLLNRIPEFRYNSVFSYKPAHFLKLKELSKEKDLEFKKIEDSRNKINVLKKEIESGQSSRAVSPVTESLFQAEKRTVVLSFIDKTGYPQMVPLNHAELMRGGRVVFMLTPYEHIFSEIEDDSPIAVFVLDHSYMGAVLVNGRMQRQNIQDESIGYFDIQKVYNPMLPVIGYVYPEEQAEYKKIEQFQDTLYEYNV